MYVYILLLLYTNGLNFYKFRACGDTKTFFCVNKFYVSIYLRKFMCGYNNNIWVLLLGTFVGTYIRTIHKFNMKSHFKTATMLFHHQHGHNVAGWPYMQSMLILQLFWDSKISGTFHRRIFRAFKFTFSILRGADICEFAVWNMYCTLNKASFTYLFQNRSALFIATIENK